MPQPKYPKIELEEISYRPEGHMGLTVSAYVDSNVPIQITRGNLCLFREDVAGLHATITLKFGTEDELAKFSKRLQKCVDSSSKQDNGS